MATTLRILVQNPAPLDGVTSLPPGCAEQIVDDRNLGIGILTLGPAQRFGVFDPGLVLRAGGRQSSHMLHSLTVLSCAAPLHEPGSSVSLRPQAFDGPLQDRVLADLGADLLHAQGLWPLVAWAPCPPRHVLAFDTRADGEMPGPHVVQMTWGGARLPSELAVGEFPEA